jgi:hypothetical protein
LREREKGGEGEREREAKDKRQKINAEMMNVKSDHISCYNNRRINSIFPVILICFISFINNGCRTVNEVIENDSVLIKFTEDLKGVKSIIDKKTGRDWASGEDSVLYVLRFGENYQSSKMITSAMSVERKAKKTRDGIELQFTHKGEIPLTIICSINTSRGSSLIYWSVKVLNESDKKLCSVEYPVMTCKYLPENSRRSGGVLYPVFEGVLLTGLAEMGAGIRQLYPGKLSAQLMYYYDHTGGFYYAAHDGQGYKKALSLKNLGKGITFSQEYLLPVELRKEILVPYNIVTGFSGGRWEAGAGIYRDWAKGQEWCNKRLIDREDVPAWLKHPNLFINYSYITPAFSTVEKADKIIKNYHDFFKMPIIATGFGWEKNEIWIGPDYFPPVHGDSYYKDLSGKIKERGDHLHVFTSGFRWAIKKPVKNPNGTTGFTKYDGTEDFKLHGAALASIDQKGEMILEKRDWAYNYSLCVGSAGGRELMAGIYNHLAGLGIDGVDLDQNLGGEVDNCFNDKHGHAIGAGLWQYQVMKEFFGKVRSEGKKQSGDMFMGVEEPCEIFIPQLDAFHGRAYTDTEWPVVGPGGVSVPLFIYLYHPYQIGYSGWIDNGFSALGDVRYGMGRSYIFGMYPGVRTSDSYNQTTGMYSEGGGYGKFDLSSGIISEELKMLKGYTELMKSYPEFLVHGEMIYEAEIKGCDTINFTPVKRKKLAIPWLNAQGIVWLSGSGKEVAYALANLSSADNSSVKVKLDKRGKGKPELIYYDFNIDTLVKKEISGINEDWVTISLKPWQLCLIRQSF